ncbi:hypothetical protein K8R47_03305 [archaeon]|nr:hypothetical protein [archaeon]
MALLRKGQTEIFGLILIVVIVIILGTFALNMYLNKQPSSINEDYLRVYANNLKTAIIQNSICDISIRKEIENCNSGYTQCLHSCSDLNQEIGNILNKTVEKNLNYEFSYNTENIKIGECIEKITSNNFANIQVVLCYK